MGEAWRQPWLCHSVYEASSKLCHLCEPCFPICQLEIETVPPSQVAAGVHEVGVQGAYLARLSIVNPTASGAGAPVTPPQTSDFYSTRQLVLRQHSVCKRERKCKSLAAPQSNQVATSALTTIFQQQAGSAGVAGPALLPVQLCHLNSSPPGPDYSLGRAAPAHHTHLSFVIVVIVIIVIVVIVIIVIVVTGVTAGWSLARWLPVPWLGVGRAEAGVWEAPGPGIAVEDV